MSDRLFSQARERAILEGHRIFTAAIDAATGTTAQERRQAIDGVCDRLVRRVAREALTRR